MKQHTPFARLGHMHKSAMSKGDMGMLAADIGIGSIPVVGSVWNAGRGLWSLGKGVAKGVGGDWKGALGELGNAGIYGLGVAGGLVGAGGAAGALKGGIAAAKLTRAGLAASRVAGAAGKLSGIGRAAQGTGVVAKGAQGLQAAGRAVDTISDAGRVGINRLNNWGGQKLYAASQGAGVGARGANAVMGGTQKIQNAYNAVGNMRLPFKAGPMGRAAGKAVVDQGTYIGAGTANSMLTGGAAPAAVGATTPAVAAPIAPAWYQAATGSATVPQFT